ncbi:hypothetical protein [Tsukamurella sp. USMM236]|uniref:hypothetical protein n=1 Tax=Tsukamurella sp. USMM236 TaxID=3081301 RepID=UPI003015F935
MSDNLDLSKVTRITVVDSEYGRVFERYNLYRDGVELHLQDDGRTLKVFPRTTSSERASRRGELL